MEMQNFRHNFHLIFLIFILYLYFPILTSTNAQEIEKPKIIVEIDMGLDDYISLLHLIDAENKGQIEILAVFCALGNAPLIHTCKNAIRTLEMLNKSYIPIYQGSPKTLNGSDEFEKWFGEDGFGDFNFSSSADLSIIKPEPSYIAIKNLVLQYPKQIILIGLSPLTNLALAIQQNPNLATELKELWVMGGNSDEKGNANNTGEFNFQVDPEAVEIVLNSKISSINILTYGVCYGTQEKADWKLDEIGNQNSPMVQLIRKVIEAANIYEKNPNYGPYDSLLTAAAIYPHIINQKQNSTVSVEIKDPPRRGIINIDYTDDNNFNAVILRDLDPEKYRQIFDEMNV